MFMNNLRPLQKPICGATHYAVYALNRIRIWGFCKGLNLFILSQLQGLKNSSAGISASKKFGRILYYLNLYSIAI